MFENTGADTSEMAIVEMFEMADKFDMLTDETFEMDPVVSASSAARLAMESTYDSSHPTPIVIISYKRLQSIRYPFIDATLNR